MFTGLIEQVGRLERVEPQDRSARLTVSVGPLAADLSPGESVAVDGACLTVESAAGGAFTAFASRETLRCTTLGAAQPGRAVNIERSLRLGDRLGGHWVAGHVDGTGLLAGLDPRDEGFLLRIAASEALLAELFPKGSVCVDGISLTLAEIRPGEFTVWVIPETYRRTALRERRPGDAVNLETDLIGKHVRRQMQQAAGEAGAGRTGGGLFDLLGVR